MGFFSRTPAPTPSGAPRARQLYIERNGAPVPPLSMLPAQAAAVLGVAVSDVDEMAAMMAAHRIFGAAAENTAQATGRQGTAAAIDRVIDTVGFDDDAIWDVVFAYGPGGVAIAEHIVSNYFATGRFAEVIANHLRESGGVQSYTALADPGLEMSDPAQIAWKIMSDLGLYYIVAGEGGSHDLVDAVANAVGDGQLSIAAPLFGNLGDDMKWCVYEGERGSAFVLLPLVEGGSDLTELMRIVDQLDALPSPWRCFVGKKGAVVPAPVAQIIGDGRLVSVDTFDAAAPGDVRGHRRAIRASLTAGGFESIGSSLWKGVLPGAEGRTQLLWVSMGQQLRILSPILTTQVIPDWLAAHDFGRYDLELFEPFATLGLWVDYQQGVDGLREEALRLARYADECEASLTGPASDEL